MPAIMTLTISDQEPIRIGKLANFHFSLPASAGNGRTTPRAIDFTFARELGEQPGNVADVAFFQIIVGDGAGEVKDFDVHIDISDGAGQALATIDMRRTRMGGNGERDGQPGPRASLLLVTKDFTYQPAGGGAAITHVCP